MIEPLSVSVAGPSLINPTLETIDELIVADSLVVIRANPTSVIAPPLSVYPGSLNRRALALTDPTVTAPPVASKMATSLRALFHATLKLPFQKLGALVSHVPVPPWAPTLTESVSQRSCLLMASLNACGMPGSESSKLEPKNEPTASLETVQPCNRVSAWRIGACGVEPRHAGRAGRENGRPRAVNGVTSGDDWRGEEIRRSRDERVVTQRQEARQVPRAGAGRHIPSGGGVVERAVGQRELQRRIRPVGGGRGDDQVKRRAVAQRRIFRDRRRRGLVR